jgi:hypothetical protein
MPANSSGRMNLKHDASTSFLSGRARCARCTQGEVPAATLESRALGGTAAGGGGPPPPPPDMSKHPTRDMSNGLLRRSLRNMSVDRDSRKRDDDETMRHPTDE